jgi:hypothetical protein
LQEQLPCGRSVGHGSIEVALEGELKMRSVDAKVEGARVVRAQGGERRFVTRQIAGETLIIPIASQVGDLDAIYTLNEVGSRIWALLEDLTPVTRIAETVAAEYDVAPDEATKDVVEFLASLEAKGLIRSDSTTGS